MRLCGSTDNLQIEHINPAIKTSLAAGMRLKASLMSAFNGTLMRIAYGRLRVVL